MRFWMKSPTSFKRSRTFQTDPFDRYTDLSGLTEIHLKIGHVFDLAEDRKFMHSALPRVKSGFYCDKVVGFGIARMCMRH